MTVLPHPRSLPRRSPSMSANSELEKVINPAQSSRLAPASPMLTIRDAATAIVTIPIGALTKKIHRHPNVSVRAPPASGPTATATPTVAPQAAIALPRSRPSNSWPISASSGGKPSPPYRCPGALTLRSGAPAVRSTACRRGQGEHADTDDEHGLPAEAVSHRPARQDERRQRQGVCVNRPLHLGEASAQLAVDRRQRHLHDGDVNEQHGGRPHTAIRVHQRRWRPPRHQRTRGGPSGRAKLRELSDVIVMSSPVDRLLLPGDDARRRAQSHRSGGRCEE